VANVLDAYALVALIADEPAAGAVEKLLRSCGATITSINLAEAADVASRVHRIDARTVRNIIEPLILAGSLDVAAPPVDAAWTAARVRTAYYTRRGRALSIADCFLLAAAERGDHVATADPVVADVARAEGIRVIALPDSSGRRP
jgi:PIN domain nuclease of toxin-antitoxin system